MRESGHMYGALTTYGGNQNRAKQQLLRCCSVPCVLLDKGNLFRISALGRKNVFIRLPVRLKPVLELPLTGRLAHASAKALTLSTSVLAM